MADTPKKSRPKPAEALAEARNLPPDSETRFALFSGSRGSALAGFNLNLTAALAADFRVAASEYAQEVSRRTIVPYVPGRKPDDFEMPWLAIDAIPELQPILDQAESVDLLASFDPDSREAKAVKIAVVSVRKPNPGWVHYVRSTSLKSRLRKSKSISVVLQDGVYGRLDADVLEFDRKFDAILARNVVLMPSQGSFERGVGFLDQAGPAAQDTLGTITNQLRIEGIEDLHEAAGSDTNMIAKLRGIQAKIDASPSYAKAMTMPSLVEFVKKRPDLEIDLVGEQGEESLVFHADPRRRWRILKLLDDDYLHSELTQLDYEANSKVAIS